MMRLLLIRHAKSSWDVPGQPDHERPLNPRGRRGARTMGRWLKREDLRPELGLVSTAVRARETWDGILAELGPVPTRTVPELYHATPEIILAVLRAVPAASPVALVGHQPGIGEAARRLLAEPPRTATFRKYPTAATTVIAFDAPQWQALAWGTGRLEAFVTPKTLEE